MQRAAPTGQKEINVIHICRSNYYVHVRYNMLYVSVVLDMSDSLFFFWPLALSARSKIRATAGGSPMALWACLISDQIDV